MVSNRGLEARQARQRATARPLKASSWLAFFSVFFFNAEIAGAPKLSLLFPISSFAPSPAIALAPEDAPVRPERRRQSLIVSREGNRGKQKGTISESDRASLVERKQRLGAQGSRVHSKKKKHHNSLSLFSLPNAKTHLEASRHGLLTDSLEDNRSSKTRPGEEEEETGSVCCRKESRGNSLSKNLSSRGRGKGEKCEATSIFFFSQ